MRQFLYLIVIAAAAYLGYAYFTGKSPVDLLSGPSSEPAATQPAASRAATEEPPLAVFRSKIVIPPSGPGEKHLAPLGTFYMLERVSVQIPTGVAAVVPGEPVSLMLRKGGGVLKVSSGKFEFEVKEEQVTNDLDVAQEAERKDFAAHPRPVKR